MIPQISQALSKGFNSKSIVDYLLKKFPQHSGKIKDAMAAGFTVDQIIKFLSGGKEALASIEKETEFAPTEFQQMRNRDIQRREEVNKKALQGAGMAATALAAPMAASALQRAIPSNLAPMIPILTEQSLPQTQQQQPLESPPLNLGNASIQQTSNIQQPKVNSNVINKLWLSFEKGRDKGFDFESDAFLRIAKRMKSTGEIKSKEDFEKFFNLFDAKKNEGKDLPTALKEASAEYDNQKLSPQVENQPEIDKITQDNEKFSPEIDITGMGKGIIDNLYNGLFESLQKGSDTFAGIKDPFLKKAKEPFEKGLIKSPEDLRKFANGQLEQPKIEKNSVVSSPNGVGEVKEIRNGQAIVEVDGKLHKVKEEDLETSPLPEKDLADLYDELISGIEGETGEDVSRMVQWAGYNPDTNTLQFLPHTGKLYTYGDISEEDAALLRDILSTRKTTGSNFIGAWKAGSKSPIGAALSKLIRKLQSERGGKGKEYESSYEPIYSAYEPAIEAKIRKRKKRI